MKSERISPFWVNGYQPFSAVNRIVLNFYPEEITSLSYITYDESACTFNFSRGETAKYLLSWDYDTDGSYVEVQYGQNGMWHTVNEQKHSGEHLLTANDGMSVRMSIRSEGSVSYSDGQVKYSIGVTVNRFSIEEADEDR